MSRAAVVVESMFGNTRRVADAIAEGLAEVMEVQVVEVSAAPVAPSVDLLVLGGPTHALGMSRKSSRADAARRGAAAPDVALRRGLLEYVSDLHHTSYPVLMATFDTRVRRPGVPGSAAKAARRRLVRAGARVVLPPESFYVSDVSGPLLPGELDRARQWGTRLAGSLRATAP
jgi:hypothetical protein